MGRPVYIGAVQPNYKTLYEALTARDSRFDDIFFVGVTLTGKLCNLRLRWNSSLSLLPSTL
jgi:hypothetical protein